MVEYSFITQASDIDVLRGKTSQFKNFNVCYDEETLDYLKTHLADADFLLSFVLGTTKTRVKYVGIP